VVAGAAGLHAFDGHSPLHGVQGKEVSAFTCAAHAGAKEAGGREGRVGAFLSTSATAVLTSSNAATSTSGGSVSTASMKLRYLKWAWP
jgi:hypothetical protein